MAYRFGQAKTGADTLAEGMSQILEQMMRQKQMQQQNAYQQAQTGIAQTQEQRAQQLLPYQIEQYKSSPESIISPSTGSPLSHCKKLTSMYL